MKAACIIPTFNDLSAFARLLTSLKRQSLDIPTFVVDSSSTDGTPQYVRENGVEITEISTGEFNHGATRQMMVERHPDFDVYIFLTQDAYLDSDDSIERLLKPFSDNKVGVVCGRQLPHRDASLMAEHARIFNYPSKSSVRTIADAPKFGIKTPFISNSFSAYRREALLDAGGFPKNVILSEDMYVAAQMLMKGWKVAYAGDACCFHSHNYTILEEFRRYFDTGVFHAREAWIRKRFGGAGGEGKRYVLSELRFLGLRHIYLWPRAFINNALKLLGYKLGQQERRIPLWLKRRLSMHKRFWGEISK